MKQELTVQHKFYQVSEVLKKLVLYSYLFTSKMSNIPYQKTSWKTMRYIAEKKCNIYKLDHKGVFSWEDFGEYPISLSRGIIEDTISEL